MTFSIVARCADTGQFGMAISSSSPAVAARCTYTRAGVGVVASQNITDPRLGTAVLDAMQQGLSAMDALKTIVSAHRHRDYRQLLVVDDQGNSATHSGPRALGIWSALSVDNAAAGGNLLANDQLPRIMLDCWHQEGGHLGDRLLAALRAGLDAGGEAGPVHSAGLQLCASRSLASQVLWPVADLRCDWTEHCPIDAIEAAWQVYKPQLDDYITRALDPAAAPSYGVPGDDT